MNKTTLEKIKTSLLKEKSELEKELAGFAKKDDKIKDNYRSDFPEFGDSEEDNALEVAAYSDQLSIEHTLETKLRDLNKALKSIADGKYGICQHCGNPIQEQRLLVRPTSTSCVDCKKKLKGEA
jgi:RNA polymerase-binding protein DksA